MSLSNDKTYKYKCIKSIQDVDKGVVIQNGKKMIQK